MKELIKKKTKNKQTGFLNLSLRKNNLSFGVWEHADLTCECSSPEVKIITGSINACVQQHSTDTVRTDVFLRSLFLFFFPTSDAELPPDGKRNEYVSVSVKHINWQANTLQRLHQFTRKRNKWTDKRAAHFLSQR